MNKHTPGPYFTIARFDSVCPETGMAIKRGERVAYYPSARKAYHDTSKQADELRGLQFADNCGMADANW